MEVGKTIKELRTDAGMSQDELAGKAFVSRQTISNWENGKFYPDVQSLATIADLFGTSIDDLVKGDLPMMNSRIAKEDVRSLRGTHCSSQSPSLQCSSRSHSRTSLPWLQARLFGHLHCIP